MAGFNGSGTYVRFYDWTTDKANTVAVTASRMDEEDDGFATGLTNTICKDGQSSTTARIPFASGVSAAAGTTSAAAFAQTGDLNSGLYFPGTDQWGLTAGGTATLTSSATALLAGVVFSPVSSDGAALGTTSLMWSDLFLASGAVINFNNGDATLTHSANTIAFAGASSGYTFDALVTPAASDGAPLGSATVMWSDLFLASGAVVNFNNGDVTLTHSANTLAVAGGTLTCEALSPSGDVAVATNKFTVASASGNTLVAGTLAVTGASTLTGALTANNSAGVTAINTVKAFGKVVNAAKVAGFNFASLTDNGSSHTITFTNAMADADYAIVLTIDGDNSATTDNIIRYHTVAAGSFRVEVHRPTVSGNVDPDSYSFMVLSST